MKILLACDLDNTLIHSFRHVQPGEPCIEWLNGNEQSYMTRKTFEILSDGLPEDILVVPITSRSIAQYQRIIWPQNQAPRYALTSGGGILLEQGEENNAWKEQSRAINESFGAAECFAKAAELLSLMPGLKSCRMIDSIYLFAHFYSEESASKALSLLKQAESDAWKDRISALLVRRKLYLFSPAADKGAALERLKAKFDADLVLAAGDSSPDLSMLKQADLALIPDSQMADSLIPASTKICPESIPFSDFILQTALSCLDDLRK